MMHKIMGWALVLLCLTGCVRDDDTLYYPVGNVNLENGGAPLAEGQGTLVARCYQTEEAWLDTVAIYPDDPTVGKLTFMVMPKLAAGDAPVPGFNGVGDSQLHMSLGYKDGNYAADCQVPVFTTDDPTASYAVKLRLKGELLLTEEEWMVDFVYLQLAGLFQPYPPASFPEVFMCKGGEQPFAWFDSQRRSWTFDVEYNRSDLSFNQLFFHLFVNLAGQKRSCEVKLRIDKESFFEIYKTSPAETEPEQPEQPKRL